MSVQKEDKKAQQFQILHFYRCFSNYIIAVKGLTFFIFFGGGGGVGGYSK